MFKNIVMQMRKGNCEKGYCKCTAEPVNQETPCRILPRRNIVFKTALATGVLKRGGENLQDFIYNLTRCSTIFLSYY